MSKVEIADLFREVIDGGALKATKEQWKVANDIMNCRTAFLGGHMYFCAACNKEHPRYNSCRNRHCPKCQGEASARWLNARTKELLPVPYFHLVFTIPHELNGLMLQNKAVVLNILFRSVNKALNDLVKTRLKGEIGFFSVLHTWGQKLEAHPHIHCVIPGVIIKKDGSIELTEDNYLLPKNVISPVFRAIFIKSLVRAYKSNKLKFHGKELNLASANAFFKLIKLIKSKHWLVYAKKPFAGPEVVLKYLARYTHKVAISNSRIIKAENASVTFLYKDYSKNNEERSCTLETTEFLRRFLLHVLPHQFVRIRHCGFLANGKRAKALARLRLALNRSIPNSLSKSTLPTCPHCGSDKIIRRFEIVPSYKTGSLAHRKKTLPLVA